MAALAAPLAWFKKPEPTKLIDLGENWVCYDKRRIEELVDLWYVGFMQDGKNFSPPGPITIRVFKSGRLSVSSNGEEWKPQISEKPWLVYRLDHRGGIRFRVKDTPHGIMPVDVDWWYLRYKPEFCWDVQTLARIQETKRPFANEPFEIDWIT